MLVAINIGDAPFPARFDAGCARAQEMLSGQIVDLGGGFELPAYSAMFWKMER